MPRKVLLKGAGMGQPCLWEPVFRWQGISFLVSRKSDVLQAIVNGRDTIGWLTVFGGAWIYSLGDSRRGKVLADTTFHLGAELANLTGEAKNGWKMSKSFVIPWERKEYLMAG